MPTGPRPWPNNALEARNESAELANAGILILRRLLEPRLITGEEYSKRVGIAIDYFQTIARFMEREGAPTLPVVPPIRQDIFS